MPELAATIWAYGPSASPQQPPKDQIAAWGTWIESLVNLAYTSSLVYDDRADLFANLVPAANVPALVIGDPTPGFDGLYMKIGATTTGSWTQLGDVPGYNVVRFSNVGAGSANAIEATAGGPVSPVAGAQIYTLNITANNTGDVTLNGRALLTSSGNQITANGLVTGMNVVFVDDGTSYRLLSDQASAAVMSAVEAMVTEAEGFRDEAQGFRNQALEYAGALSADRIQFVTVSGLLDDNNDLIGYAGSGAEIDVAEDAIVWAEGYRFAVASSGASDHHKATAGGVKLYALPTNGSIFAEQVGTPRDGVTSAVAGLNLASQVATALGATLRSAGDDGGYLIDDTIELPANCEITCPMAVTAGADFNYIYVGEEATYDTLDFGDLAGATEFSSRITGLPADCAGRYLHIISDEVLTERASNASYTKQSAVYVLNASGDITPSLDATFNADDGVDPYTIEVRLYHPVPRTRCRLASIISTASSDEIEGGIILRQSNCDFSLGYAKTEGAQFRTLLSITGDGCRIDAPRLDDTLYTGLGYGISIGRTCGADIDGANSGLTRTAIDGRHNALTTVRNARCGVVGSHWANDCRFIDCDVEHIAYAGKDLTVRGGTLRGSYAISARADVMLCTGKLSVKDVKLGKDVLRLLSPSGTFSSTASYFTESRRMFDEIDVDGVSTLSTGGVTLLTQDIALSQAGNFEYDPPRKMRLRNIYAPFVSALTVLAWNMEVSPNLDYTPVWSIADVVAPVRATLFAVRGFVDTVGPANGVDFRIENCRQGLTLIDANVIQQMVVRDTDIQARRVNGKTARGRTFIFGGAISNHGSTTSETPVIAHGVTFLNAANQYTWAAKLGCRAASGAGAAAAAADFVSPTYYDLPSGRTGFAAMTGTATKTTIATYTAPTFGGTYSQSDLQALGDAVQALARRVKAIDDALLAAGTITT